MVRGANKSRSRKRIDVKTMSGSSHKYVEKKVSRPISISGKPLPSTVRGTKNEIAKVAKTQRRPNRPYGGVMDSKELRSYLRAQARLSSE